MYNLEADFRNIKKEKIFEFDNGDYVYVDIRGHKLIAGGATNMGIIPEFEMELDYDKSIEENLADFYYLICDEKHI